MSHSKNFVGIGGQNAYKGNRDKVHRHGSHRQLHSVEKISDNQQKEEQSYSKTVLANRAEIVYDFWINNKNHTYCDFKVSIFLPGLTDKDEYWQIVDKFGKNLTKSFLPKHVNAFYTDVYINTDIDDKGEYIDFNLERDNYIVFAEDKEFFDSCNRNTLQKDFENAIGNSLNY